MAETVHALLGDGCAHTPVAGRGINSVPGAPRGAYAHLRGVLRKSLAAKPGEGLSAYFHKTYREMNGWLHLFQMYYRVYVFHAVLLHLSVCLAYGGWDWNLLCTWVITHALLKATRQAVFMLLMWPLKARADESSSAQKAGGKESRFSRSFKVRRSPTRTAQP